MESGCSSMARHAFTFEGNIVHFPAPRCHYAKDIVFEKDTPIFCTCKQDIVFVKGGVVDEKETEKMRVRWREFSLTYQIPEQDQKSVPSCPKCFSKFILC